MSGRGDVDASLEALLRERARSLAERRLETVHRDVLEHVIAVRRGRSSFGVPIGAVEEVRRVRVVPVPGAGGHAPAIFALRGRIHGLVDLQALTGAPEIATGAETLALVAAGADGRTLGLRIDEVVGPRTVLADEVDRARRDRRLGFVAAVTTDCLEVIDVAALFEECARPRAGS